MNERLSVSPSDAAIQGGPYFTTGLILRSTLPGPSTNVIDDALNDNANGTRWFHFYPLLVLLVPLSSQFQITLQNDTFWETRLPASGDPGGQNAILL